VHKGVPLRSGERNPDRMNIEPTNHDEAVAIFRASVIGPVMHRELAHGQLAPELRELSEQRFRPPGAKSTRTFSVPTLERWLYAYRAEGLDGLKPARRSDCGYAQELSDEQRELLLDIRREHPDASVPLILKTLVDEGRIEEGKISGPTLRRLYAAAGLPRCVATDNSRVRLRWQAEKPGALWHGDVCHWMECQIAGKTTPIRIHGMLDDAARYGIALEAHMTEKEEDMLLILVDALRRHGKPDGLYLDNGATYRGEILRTVCARLGITLLHAKPYDPQARGKMERFWRTLREGCLNFLGNVASLEDVNARLKAFLDKRYHVSPHAGLMGKSPLKIYVTRDARVIDEQALRAAMTIRNRRRISNDNVLSFDGTSWEIDQTYMAGQTVTVASCFAMPGEAPWVEHEGKRLVLRPLDATKNGVGKRPARPGPCATKPTRVIEFHPMNALMKNGKDEGGVA
jgi:putative transposase